MRTGSTLRLSVADSLPSPSSARVREGGTASSTASKPEYTCCESSAPAVRSCQRLGSSASGSICVTCVPVTRLAPSGEAQWATSASMPGWATQCGSSEGKAASATRPWASSTRTRLALQRLHRPGVASSARAKRGSRTVKYCAPLSKLPKAVSMLAMRPPAACSRVRTA
jgi:hypothetical protein